jgi:Outer membrane protein beta-barrel domain
MKKIFILLTMMAAATAAMSQRAFILSNIDKRGFMNLSMGISIPAKSFLKADESAPSQLMAYQGSAVQFSAGYRLNHRFGVQTNITTCTNQADARPLIVNAERSGVGNQFTANTGTWNCAFITVGPYITYSAGLWLFDARLNVGYSLIQKPAVDMTGDYFKIKTTLQTSNDNSNAFTMGAGATVRYRVGRNFALAIHADYLTAKPTFNQVSNTLNVGGDEIKATVREVKPLASFTLNGGLSLLF